MEEAYMTFLKKWREIPAQLAAILKEITLMRTATQHLTEAMTALTTSVANGNAQIKSELDTLLQAHNDEDDSAVEAAAAKIKDLSASIDASVSAAQTALTTAPVDPAAAKPQG